MSLDWRMVGRVVVGLLLALVGVAAARAQLQGHISMAKNVYFAGEPVYVLFEYTNVGKDAVQYSMGDPYAEGCGGYKLEVSEKEAKGSANCKEPGANECIAGSEILAAGETRHQLILVNYAHDLSKAGNYEIHATQEMKYAAATGDVRLSATQQQFKVEQRFTIQVVKADRERLEAIYKPYVVNLSSQDDEIQRGGTSDCERCAAVARRYDCGDAAAVYVAGICVAGVEEFEYGAIARGVGEDCAEHVGGDGREFDGGALPGGVGG